MIAFLITKILYHSNQLSAQCELKTILIIPQKLVQLVISHNIYTLVCYPFIFTFRLPFHYSQLFLSHITYYTHMPCSQTIVLSCRAFNELLCVGFVCVLSEVYNIRRQHRNYVCVGYIMFACSPTTAANRSQTFKQIIWSTSASLNQFSSCGSMYKLTHPHCI